MKKWSHEFLRASLKFYLKRNKTESKTFKNQKNLKRIIKSA